MSAIANKPWDLLTEVERQERYLAELPEDYEFPLFSGRQAVESQRKSGYKDTARAAREIVDNALEAGAKNIHVVFDYPKESSRGKHERRDAVSAIAFIDDGPGMLPKMVRYALTWGGGTHFKDPKRIGKFGFGLPNSSINQTRRVDVYSRVKGADGWTRASLDINEVPTHGLLRVEEPESYATLPAFVQHHLKRSGLKLESGTVVVWDKPDRLSYRRGAQLKEHLLEDFGVVYRGLLDQVRILVEETPVEMTDPLFLTPGARYFVPKEDGGAECTRDLPLAVRYSIDEETGGHRLDWLQTDADIEQARSDPSVKVIDTVRVRVARFPYGLVLGEKQHKGTDAHKRFEIRKGRRGMSFVRAGREIETVDVFPKSARDEASGLGSWPLLQSYAYHWGIEVVFGPALDEVFGIGNDKQTVRPIEDFWRVLAKAEIDRLLREEEKFQDQVRKGKRKAKAAEAQAPEQPTPASEAAAQAMTVTGRSQLLPESRRSEASEVFAEEARRRAEAEGQLNEEGLKKAREAIHAEAERKLYAIGFFEAEGGVFYRPTYGNGLQRVAALNKAHPFFEVFYSAVANLPDPRARSALDLLLMALAEAELGSEDEVAAMYEHQREAVWSPFLKAGLKVLDRMFQPGIEQEQEGDGAA